MKVVIIEDEQATALRLEKLLKEIEPAIEVQVVLDSIKNAVTWFNNNQPPDIVFQDIHLADGSSFEIFDQVKLNVPIVFITAFDQYAMQAFKVNSIDYLLKPVKKAELAESIQKFKSLYAKKLDFEPDYAALARLITKRDFQKRFVVRYGQKIKAVDVDEIAYFYTDAGNIFFRTHDNEQYPMDLSLDKLEAFIDPDKFYRVNRQFIISYPSIKEMYTYSKSRVRIILQPPCELETIASTDRSSDFKKWLTGNSEPA
jgi:DNA-binding LytR/AlgR family response regulator